MVKAKKSANSGAKKFQEECLKLQKEIFDYCELHDFQSHHTRMMTDAFEQNMENPWEYFIEYIRKNIILKSMNALSSEPEIIVESTITATSSLSAVSQNRVLTIAQNGEDPEKETNGGGKLLEKIKSKGKKLGKKSSSTSVTAPSPKRKEATVSPSQNNTPIEVSKQNSGDRKLLVIKPSSSTVTAQSPKRKEATVSPLQNKTPIEVSKQNSGDRKLLVIKPSFSTVTAPSPERKEATVSPSQNKTPIEVSKQNSVDRKLLKLKLKFNQASVTPSSPKQKEASLSPRRPLILIPSSQLKTPISASRSVFMRIPKRKESDPPKSAEKEASSVPHVEPSTSTVAGEQSASIEKTPPFKLKIAKVVLKRLDPSKLESQVAPVEEKRATKRDSKVLSPAPPEPKSSGPKFAMKVNSPHENDEPPTKMRLRTPSMMQVVTIQSSHALPPLIRVQEEKDDETEDAAMPEQPVSSKSIETCEEDVIMKEPTSQSSEKVFAEIDKALGNLHGKNIEESLTFKAFFESPAIPMQHGKDVENINIDGEKAQVSIFDTDEFCSNSADKIDESSVSINFQKLTENVDDSKFAEQPIGDEQNAEIIENDKKVVEEKAEGSIFDTEIFSTSEELSPKVEIIAISSESDDVGSAQKSTAKMAQESPQMIIKEEESSEELPLDRQKKIFNDEFEPDYEPDDE